MSALIRMSLYDPSIIELRARDARAEAEAERLAQTLPPWEPEPEERPHLGRVASFLLLLRDFGVLALMAALVIDGEARRWVWWVGTLMWTAGFTVALRMLGRWMSARFRARGLR